MSERFPAPAVERILDHALILTTDHNVPRVRAIPICCCDVAVAPIEHWTDLNYFYFYDPIWYQETMMDALQKDRESSWPILVWDCLCGLCFQKMVTYGPKENLSQTAPQGH